MEATKFLSSSTALPPLSNHQVSSLSMRRKIPRKHLNVFMDASRSSRGSSKSYGGDQYGGRVVDENMIVLRMRIRETKMAETKSEPPSEWMEWEKKYYAYNGYDEDVCEAIGFLQNCLMNMRPALALGLIALVALSLVISAGVVLFHAFQLANLIFSGFCIVLFHAFQLAKLLFSGFGIY